MKKIKIIESYIKDLENTLYSFKNELVIEEGLIDLVLEIKNILMNDLPHLNESFYFQNNTAEIDTKILIGILKLYLANNENEKTVEKNQSFEEELNKLKLEFEGISDIIKKYTSQGDINNYLNQLELALSSLDLGNIKYCLSKINDWYNKNKNKIHSSIYVFNKDTHEENQEKVAYFNEVFKTFDSSKMISAGEIQKISEPVVFLSHKSDDKKYADALRNFIIGLGIKINQLIYTSHPLHKIPLDANIYDYLRNCINNKIFMIILWSDKYLESPACLNEMGAAWVVQSDYTNIYTRNIRGNK